MTRTFLVLSVLSLILSACTLTANLISESMPEENTPITSQPIFGDNGLVTFHPQSLKISGENDAGAIAIQSDGKILVGGYAETSGSEDFAIVRYNPDGTIDPTFAENGVFSYSFDNEDYDRVLNITLQNDGKILLAGTTTDAATGANPFSIMRLLPDGNIDTTFGANGLVRLILGTFNDQNASTIAFQSDGRIIVGGTVRDGGGQLKVVAIRLSTQGELDSTFAGNNGYALIDASGSNNGIGELKITSTDQIVIAGDTTGPGSWDTMVARLSPNGILDPTFGTGGIYKADLGSGGRDLAKDLLPLSDGSLIITGYHDTAGLYTANIYLLKLTPAGALDTTFNGTGLVSTNTGSNTENARNIFAVAGGYLVTGADNGRALTLKYTAAGALDTSFNGTGYSHTDPTTFYDSINSSAYFGGEIYYVGYIYDATEDYLTFKLKSDGTLDNTFNGTGTVITDIQTERHIDIVKSVRLSSGKTLVINHLQGDNDTLLGLTRLNADGSIDTNYGTQGTLVVGTVDLEYINVREARILSSGKILLAGDRDDDALLIRLNQDGTLDTSFNGSGILTNIKAGTNEFISDFLELPNGNIVGVGASNSDTALFRFTGSGAVDNTFGTNGIVINAVAGPDQGISIAKTADGKYVVGGTISNMASLFRFSEDGSLDTAFGGTGYIQHRFAPTSSDEVKGLHLLDDGSFLLAGNTHRGTDYDMFIMKIFSDGTLDSTFGSSGKMSFGLESGKSDILRDFKVQADGKILAVGDITRSWIKSSLLIRFNPDGSLDSGFANSGVREFEILANASSDYANSVDVDENNNIWVSCESEFQLGISALVKFD